MRRAPATGPRGVLEVDWPFFGEICRALALRVARDDYQPEIVLGVAKAGVIPGVVVASILQSEFTSMTVTRREAGEAPVLVSGPPADHPRPPGPAGGRDLRHRQHHEARAERGSGPPSGRSPDGGLVQDRRIRARLPRLRDRELHRPALGSRDRPERRAGGSPGVRGPALAALQPWRAEPSNGGPLLRSAPMPRLSDLVVPRHRRSRRPSRPAARALHARRRRRRHLQPRGQRPARARQRGP